ncbi:MAG: ROK family glucokinase [Clostridia bacterium]|nr:ROK family glucokinase [Clostridia bacterium]
MYYVGIDLGGTNIKTGIVDEQGKIIAKSSIPTKSERTADEVAFDMAFEVLNIVKTNKISMDELVGVGIGSPGAINSGAGIVDYSPNLGWYNVPIAELILKRVKKPVKVSNDANVAALGETLFGAGKGYKDTILVTLGTGVGGGVVIGGKLFEGNESKGAELGHSVIVVNGQQCGCGRRGCFEAYSSATALIRETKEAMLRDRGSKMWDFVGGDIDKVDGKTAFETEKQGDATAKLVVNNYVLYLSEGLLNLCNIFRPEAIMLGGGVCAQGDNLLNRLKTRMQALHYGYQGTPAVDLLIASLGNDAGIIGAAALLMN